MTQGPQKPTPSEKARQRRSVAIAIIIAFVVASVYTVTFIKGPFFIVDREINGQ